MKNLFLCLLLLFFSSCVRANCFCEDEKIAYQVMGQFSKKMHRRGCDAIGTGIGEEKNGEKKGKIKYLSVHLTTNRSLTFESARELAVDCVNSFLSEINQTVEFRKYLIEYPLSPKYISIIISGQDPSDNNISFVRSVIANDLICYYSDSMQPPQYGLIHKETFEEAVAILQQESNCNESCPVEK